MILASRFQIRDAVVLKHCKISLGMINKVCERCKFIRLVRFM